MSLRRFSSGFLAIPAILLALGAPGPAFAVDTPSITPSKTFNFDPWQELPATFKLTTRILDDEDNPVRWARISVGGNEVAKSARDGGFEIPQDIKPATILVIRHKYFATRRIAAGDLVNAGGRALPIHLVPYTSVFNLTPRGGFYKSGQITLEVPAGAVTSNIQVEAASLPLDFAYNNNGDLEPRRLAAVDLKPHGLKFLKPVVLTMTIAREDTPQIQDPQAFYFDEKRGRHVRDTDSKIEVDGHRIALTLTHFSSHSVADGRRRQSVQKLGRTRDHDGDGKETTGDAYFMVLASGDAHRASANFAQTVWGSVRKETPTGGTPWRIGDAAFQVSDPLPRARTEQVVEAFSNAFKWEKQAGNILDIAASENAPDCRMLLGHQEVSRAARWQRFSPGPREMAMITRAWNEGANARFKYFDWQSTRYPTAGYVLYGKQHIAVTKGDSGLEVYVRTASYIIAKLRNLEAKNCTAEVGAGLSQSAARAIAGAKNRASRHIAMKNNFHFGADTLVNAMTRDGVPTWGTLHRGEVEAINDMPCGSQQHRVWNYALDWDETSASSSAQTRTWGTTTASGTASGIAERNAVSNSVEWSIANDNPEKMSDHVMAPIYRQTPDGNIPFGFLITKTGERPCTLPPDKEDPATTRQFVEAQKGPGG